MDRTFSPLSPLTLEARVSQDPEQMSPSPGVGGSPQILLGGGQGRGESLGKGRIEEGRVETLKKK